MKTIAMNKRTQLTSVFACTALALAGVWFGLISPQREKLDTLAQSKENTKSKLQQVLATIKQSPMVESQVADKYSALQSLETGMASGDLYSWLITTIRQFKVDYKIDIPQFSQIEGPRDVTLLPAFPYQQVMVTIGGTGAYAEVGKFVSGLENDFPYIRLANLSLEPGPNPGTGADKQKLTFKVDVIALVKPTNSLLAKSK